MIKNNLSKKKKNNLPLRLSLIKTGNDGGNFCVSLENYSTPCGLPNSGPGHCF